MYRGNQDYFEVSVMGVKMTPMKHLFLGGPLHGQLVEVPPCDSSYMHPISDAAQYLPDIKVLIKYVRTRYDKPQGGSLDVFIAEMSYAKYDDVENLIKENNL